MNWYSAEDDPEVVEFGPARGLSVTGQGAPGGPAYTTSVGALYAVAGALLGIAARSVRPFGMPPLEGRWWAEDERPPLDVPREEWWWHLFLRLPEPVDEAWADEARQSAGHPAAARVQFVTFTEGLCVQVLHRGPYAEEPKTLARMDALMRSEGLVPNGLHHEIYLSDTGETDPEKMMTVLRQPVRAA
ncbi:GyrI-like domain-containing protein [Streptosporangium sp. NBC_01755]|uniref:GyrI-like domain-containing protein n=1 Tax=unclassified Streptosporangium TaxID=2632669 RepID=UPI002DDBE6D4|nr:MULTISPECIES: GyrI-like domain-containing protein [unclassified Streptosporangium]WSA25964.1 GyrI-like domain-containing protein [Streptosporangium sp. NBC_01810]WSD02647.1 GyrI-like domain-containing protein [Streptosporangium sp. NBC_01755]